MNEHKTPEQIAGDAMRDHKGDEVSTGEWWSGPAEEMHQVIVAAINADRSQRSELASRRTVQGEQEES